MLLDQLINFVMSLKLTQRTLSRVSKPNSIIKNPELERLLSSIASAGIVNPGEKARKWYNHPANSAAVAPVSSKNVANGSYRFLTKKKDQRRTVSSSILFLFYL